MTLVTGTIRDPAGNPYTNALMIASFVGQSTVPGAGPYVTGGVPQGQFETIVPGQTDSFGAFSMPLAGNDTITPTPSQWKFTVVSSTTPQVSFSVLISITGASQDISAALQAASAPLNPSVGFGNITVTGITDTGALSVSGTSTLGNVTVNQANTLTVNLIKQAAGATGFALFDPNGVAHFFISATAPYTNTFLASPSGGSIFLGGTAKAAVVNDTGQIITASNVALQTTSQTLPATIANDASGGVSETTNGGKILQWTNAGVLVVNPAALASGAALTVGGTSSSTGGLSIFVGASGSATETLANYPADGASGAVRMQALSIRSVSGGLLTGAQTFGVANNGAVTGANLTGASSGNNVTLLNWQIALAPITGNGADQVMYTFVVPANTMGAGKGIYIVAGWQHTTGTAAVTTKMKYGATTVATNSEAGTGLTVVSWYVMNNPGSTSAQTAWQEIGQDAGSSVVYSPQIATPAENTTGAVTVVVTFSVANTDAVTPKFFKVEIVQ